MSLIFSNLVVFKLLGYKIIVMHNFVTNFGKILEICKQFAGNQVNEKGNVTYRLNQKNRTKPTWAYKRLRKRRETVFSKLNDHLMMIRNYEKQTAGL